MNDPKIILGLREESRPVGGGYLYYKFSLKESDIFLLFLDLFDTSDTELASLFHKPIVQIAKKSICQSMA
jgi:hypothetical protein